ncbi:MAG: GNAT family N-acetyltransferase [Victivallales bacterium]|nr:GNAT family N-acetyltransferase [Victivallales bacterium]MCF7889186.1 GNAT family N-acetyltransferase [Victivallales bacterium]
MKFKIKKFDELSLVELYGIIKMREEVFILEQHCLYPECDGYDTEAVHLFLVEEERIIAYARILPPGIKSDESSFGRVAVEKESRGKGLANELIKNCIKYIKVLYHEDIIKISAQAYLVPFYERFGFKKVSGEYLDFEIPHIDMVKE